MGQSWICSPTTAFEVNSKAEVQLPQILPASSRASGRIPCTVPPERRRRVGYEWGYLLVLILLRGVLGQPPGTPMDCGGGMVPRRSNCNTLEKSRIREKRALFACTPSSSTN